MPRLALKTITIAAGLGSALLLLPQMAGAQSMPKPVLPSPAENPQNSGGGIGNIRSGEGAPARGAGMLDKRHRGGKSATRMHRGQAKAKAAQAPMNHDAAAAAAKKAPPTNTDMTGTTVPPPASTGPAMPSTGSTSPSPSTSMSGDKAPPTGPNSATGKTTQP